MQAAGARILMLKDAPERLLDGAKISIERMPMLHVIFERMASQCSDALRQLLPSPALFSVKSLTTERIGDVIDSQDGNSVIGIIYVQAWESRLLIGLDHDFVFALADALFGGDGSGQLVQEKRSLSNIELRLAEKAIDLVSKALQDSFATVCETTFKLDRIETRLDFVVIAPRTAFGVRAKIKVQIMGRDINIFLLIPQTALNSIRQELERDASAEMSVRDPRWSKQIQGEIGRTEISIRGVIEERQLTLADIAGLQTGQVLVLQANAKTKVKLECNAEPLFLCDLGQAEGFYTLRIVDHIDQDQEFCNDIAPQ
jgi:flagellar motor switch protein FliM